jgi:hypothetical protein
MTRQIMLGLAKFVRGLFLCFFRDPCWAQGAPNCSGEPGCLGRVCQKRRVCHIHQHTSIQGVDAGQYVSSFVE